LKGYKLFDLETDQLTDKGKELLATATESEIVERFAKHILQECYGADVLDALSSLHARNVRPSKASLQQELESRGFQLPRATTHHTKMLQWLRLAGVVDQDNQIDASGFQRLTGRSLKSIQEWDALTREQRAFLRTMREEAETHGTDLVSAKDVVDRSVFQHGRIFRDDQLSAKVFRPLEDGGWITRETGSGGRGGKSGRIAATPKLLAVPLRALTEDVDWGIPNDLRPKLNTALAQIQEDLKSTDTYTKGLALELLAIRLAADLGLTPLRLRERSAETGGAEVDLISEAAHLHFSRWLFQCKNTSSTGLADLAKEVGMAVLLHAHVIVMATTGRFRRSVKDYASELMRTTPLQVVLVEGPTISEYLSSAAGSLMRFFHSQAQQTMRLKRDQIAKEATSPAK
jgi:hypothetical protein